MAGLLVFIKSLTEMGGKSHPDPRTFCARGDDGSGTRMRYGLFHPTVGPDGGATGTCRGIGNSAQDARRIETQGSKGRALGQDRGPPNRRP